MGIQETRHIDRAATHNEHGRTAASASAWTRTGVWASSECGRRDCFERSATIGRATIGELTTVTAGRLKTCAALTPYAPRVATGTRCATAWTTDVCVRTEINRSSEVDLSVCNERDSARAGER
jgi:hypothetical protein